jgi:serine/threonine protein kinase
MLGHTLGHYRIDSKLGEGGMGVVYRAFDTHLDRAVAIKVLRPDVTASPER